MATTVNSSIDDQELIGARRQQFIKAASTLFSSMSYDTATMKEISKLAGFSAGLIYSYVENKEGMLFLVLQDLLDCYRREIPKSLENLTDPIERFCATFRAYCQVIDAHSDATLLAYRSTKALSSERREEIKRMELETNDLVADCVRRCIEAGYFREVNPDLMAYQVVMIAHGWATKRWALSEMLSLEDYIVQATELFLNGVLTESGWQRWRPKKESA
jgi:AcrR family transcriptional regulator